MTRAETSTRSTLLNAAMALMLRKGFSATSVDEICQSARVTKGSFFHYFVDKEALGKAVLDHYWQVGHERLREAAQRQDADPLQRLYAYIDWFVEISKNPQIPKSCLFGNFAQELSKTHPRLRQQTWRGFAGWADEITHDLDAVKARHVPRVDVDTQSLARHFLAIYEGALILTKAKQDPTILAENMRHFKRYIQLMFDTSSDRGGGRSRGKAG